MNAGIPTRAAALAALLAPRLVAVIGVSRDPTRLGSQILRNVVRNGFAGAIYGVARETFAFEGATIVRSLDEISGEVDVLLLAVPASALPSALEALPEGKARLAIAIASGFSETGESGEAMERQVAAICARKGIGLIGPNCQGVVVPYARLQMTFSPMYNRMVPGSVAVVSQSGAMGGFMVNRLMHRGVGLSCFVSSGNETCMEISDYVEALGGHADTRVLLCYLEQIRDGRRFAQAVRGLPPEKRLVVVKSGRSEAGAAAVRSHTGAIAGDDRVADGVLRQLGVVRAPDSAAAVDAAIALAPGRRLNGDRIGVLSVAGGLAVELADLLELRGFKVPAFDAGTNARLREIVPVFGATRNPIDLTGAMLTDESLFERALAIMSEAQGFDGWAIISTYVRNPRIARSIVDLHQRSDNPVIVCWTGSAEQTPESLEILARAGVPVYDNTARAAWAFEALRSARRPTVNASWRIGRGGPAIGRLKEIRDLLAAWRRAGRVQVNEADSKRVLALAGLPIPGPPTAHGLAVVKLCADTHLHKTEHGLLRLGIEQEEVGEVSRELREQADRLGIGDVPILVEEMAAGGLLEWLIGCRNDRSMGPVVVLGVGGVYAELFKEAQIRMAPVDLDEAVAMIRAHPAFPIIDGARGRPRANLGEFAGLIALVSELFAACSDLVSELDLNPVLLRPADLGQGTLILDAALVLASD